MEDGFLFGNSDGLGLAHFYDLYAAESGMRGGVFDFGSKRLLVDSILGLDLAKHFVIVVASCHFFLLLPGEGGVFLELLGLYKITDTGLHVLFVILGRKDFEKYVAVLDEISCYFFYIPPQSFEEPC